LNILPHRKIKISWLKYHWTFSESYWE